MSPASTGSPRMRRSRWSPYRTPSTAVQLANAIAPEHLEMITEDADAAGGAPSTTAGCVFVGERRRDRVRRLRRRVEPRAPHRRGRPLPGTARARGLPAPDRDRRDHAGRRPGSSLRRSLHWPAPRASRCTPSPSRAQGAEGAEGSMSRTAEINRETKETKVRLRLDLDGGEAKVSTGVGFLDHMLELLARHGRLGLRPRGERRPRDRRPPHDRGRRHLPRAGDRRGAGRPRRHPPLRLGARADGRGAGRVRDRHLRPALLRLRRRPPGRERSPASTPSSPRSSSAPSPTTRRSRCTLGPLRLERPPHDRGLLQGVRARAARGGLDRPGRDRGALHQGHAHRMTRIAILDYGMGNLRSVEKALERVGAEAEITSDPRPGRGRGRRDPARASARSRGRWSGFASSGSTSWWPGGSRPASPCSASASACSCSSSPRSRTRAASGLALLGGIVAPLEANGYKVPHIGWSPVRWEHDSRAHRGTGRGDALLLRPLVRPAPGDRGRRARHRRLRRALRLRGGAAAALRRPVPPGEVELRGARPAGQLRRASAVDPLSGDRHPRRQGRPADPGRLRAGDGLRRRPGGRGPALGRRRRHAGCTSSTSTAPGRASRSTSSTCGGSSPRSNVPVQLGGGLRDSKKVEEAISSGAERVVLGTAAVRDPGDGGGDRGRPRRPRGGLGRLPLRKGRGRGLDRGSPSVGTTEVIAELTERGAEPLRLHAGRGRRPDGGTRPRLAAGGRRRDRRRADLLGRHRLARRPARAGRRSGSTTSRA